MSYAAECATLFAREAVCELVLANAAGPIPGVAARPAVWEAADGAVSAAPEFGPLLGDTVFDRVLVMAGPRQVEVCMMGSPGRLGAGAMVSAPVRMGLDG